MRLYTSVILALVSTRLLSHARGAAALRRQLALPAGAALPPELDLLLWQAAQHYVGPRRASAAYKFLQREAAYLRGDEGGDEVATSVPGANPVADATSVPGANPVAGAPPAAGTRALRLLDWQIARRDLLYSAVLHSFDHIAEWPHASALDIANSRQVAATVYQRPSEEMHICLKRIKALEPPLAAWALTAVAACAQHPSLRAHILPDLIAELEAALAASEHPTPALSEPLRVAKTLRDASKA